MSHPAVLPQPTDLLPRSHGLLRLKPQAAAAPAVRRISSQALLAGERELVITHEGSEYHLRLTRNDKLILTK
ncbi:hemin uptake protein HemP [Dyella sp. BiH032]|uniref:hemin uptake protein HemP n=1 Tax=Dyella sp. BiH032 TaxID=3075430 RepID=UPI002892DE42|nr:hemin uptake protein HemP [Dyella sp. BiH032]WNL45388.1 hemin uptake protein HemP [Dyella sp. BiH032]